jgi:TetR/AcrR family transcriptional regulator, cholesterol catabolism regulator
VSMPSPRDEILAAAAEAFARRGYHGMSMRSLAKATGRSPAAFYNYFDSKEDLLFVLQRGAFDALVEEAQRVVVQTDDPWVRLDAFVGNHVRYFTAHPDVMRVLILEAATLPATRRAAIRCKKQQYFRIARDIVADLMQRASDDPEVERSTYCLFGMLNWTWGWYEPARHGSAEELAHTIQRLVVAGLAGDHEINPRGATARLSNKAPRDEEPLLADARGIPFIVQPGDRP